MKNDLTELVFILDRSGSMAGLEKDTIGGFNSMIEGQKKQEGEALVTTVLFDHEQVRLHDRVSLSSVQPMTENDYTVRGCTALLDAVGDTVEHVADVHRYIRPEDVPARTMFVITTDGMENASRRFDGNAIKKLVEQKREEGWEFLFIGANIDAIAAAGAIGIREDHAVNYRADSSGTRAVFRAVEKAARAMRACACVDASWADEIKEDFKKKRK